MKDMASSPGFATSLLYGLGQITEPLWTSAYSALNEHVVINDPVSPSSSNIIL